MYSKISKVTTSIDDICKRALRKLGRAIALVLTPVGGLFAIGYLISRIRYFELDSFILSKVLEWAIVLTIIALLQRYNTCSRRSGLNWFYRLYTLSQFLAVYFVTVVAIFGASVLLFGVGQEPLIPIDSIAGIFNTPLVFTLEMLSLFMLLYTASPLVDSRPRRREVDHVPPYEANKI